MYLRVSDISKHFGCAKATSTKLRKPAKSGGKNVIDSTRGDTQATTVGKAAHTIVQHVLKTPPEQRTEEHNKVREALNSMKNDVQMPKKISEILGDDYLSGSIHDELLMSSWKECNELLNCSMDLLGFLEKIPKSVGKWGIKKEMEIHDGKLPVKVPYKKEIFGTKTSLHGSIDLVFEFGDLLVVTELKTGEYADWKRNTWELQTQIYIDACKYIFPEKKIIGMIVHSGIEEGYQWVNKLDSWTESLVDRESTEPGDHCQYCELKATCSGSWYKQNNTLR